MTLQQRRLLYRSAFVCAGGLACFAVIASVVLLAWVGQPRTGYQAHAPAVFGQWSADQTFVALVGLAIVGVVPAAIAGVMAWIGLFLRAGGQAERPGAAPP